MKKFYIEDSEGKTKEYNALSKESLVTILEAQGISEYSFVEEPDFKELAIERKIRNIRSERDLRLHENDKEWMIASKKKQDTTDLEEFADKLRDLPEVAKAVLEELSLEEIKDYDAFLNL